MKKIFSAISILMLLLILSGCNFLNKTTTTTKNTSQSTNEFIEQYLVNFDSMEGSIVDSIYVVKGNSIPVPIVQREGYTLDGWYISYNNGITYDEKWDFATFTVSNNITLYAKWVINKYTITFQSNGGTQIDSITQDYNTYIYFPSNPGKMGYTFEGWYLDEDLNNQLTFTTMPAENVILYAKYTEFNFPSTLIIHYIRLDNNYDQWSVWLWGSEPITQVGSNFNFTDTDDLGKIFLIELEGTTLEGSSLIGLVIRTLNWDKDYPSDRYIDMTGSNEDGVVEVYIYDGNPTVYLAPKD